MRARIAALRPQRRVLVAVLIIALLLLLLASLLFSSTQSMAAPAQPIAFPHVTMVQAGINCLFCHVDAQRGPAAGIPSVEKCMGCHQTIARDRPEIVKLTKTYWDPQKPIPWQRVNRLPRYVHFAHAPHIAAGLNCERCHGDVGHMQQTYSVVTMDMGWCITCHGQQPNADQLRYCETCHY